MDYYEVLGLDPSATTTDIFRASKALLRKHHVDGPSPDRAKFLLVNEAASVLKDPEQRDQYDRVGRQCDMDEVFPRLFLGSAQAANDTHMLTRVGVTHVLTIADDVNVSVGPQFTHLR
jgi:DnaJ-class molecular chaperone